MKKLPEVTGKQRNGSCSGWLRVQKGHRLFPNMTICTISDCAVFIISRFWVSSHQYHDVPQNNAEYGHYSLGHAGEHIWKHFFKSDVIGTFSNAHTEIREVENGRMNELHETFSPLSFIIPPKSSRHISKNSQFVFKWWNELLQRSLLRLSPQTFDSRSTAAERCWNTITY